MGKKKRVKKKLDEVSEATATATTQQQPPRKRGRPRKIVEKAEIEEKNHVEEGEVVESKKAKTEDEQDNKGGVIGSVMEEEKPKETVKSKGRRKGLPRKSS